MNAFDYDVAEEIDMITAEGYRDQIILAETQKAVENGLASWIYAEDAYTNERI
jgi:hypothetical protein